MARTNRQAWASSFSCASSIAKTAAFALSARAAVASASVLSLASAARLEADGSRRSLASLPGGLLGGVSGSPLASRIDVKTRRLELGVRC